MVDHMTPEQAIAYLRAWSRTAEQIARGLQDWQQWECLVTFRKMHGIQWLADFDERDAAGIVPHRDTVNRYGFR
jgi:hypothetical protein